MPDQAATPLEDAVEGPSRLARTTNVMPLDTKLRATQQVYNALEGFSAGERHQIIQLVTTQLTREGK